MKKILLPLFALFLMLNVATAKDVTYTLTAQKPSVQITLNSNPTTGYRWTAEYNKKLIEAKSHFVAPKTKMVGAGGKEVWTFTATPQALKTTQPIQTTIRLNYTRSWEKNVKPAQTKTLFINIKP